MNSLDLLFDDFGVVIIFKFFINSFELYLFLTNLLESELFKLNLVDIVAIELKELSLGLGFIN